MRCIVLASLLVACTTTTTVTETKTTTATVAPQACRDAIDATTHVVRLLLTANKLLIQNHLTPNPATLDQAEAAVRRATALLMDSVATAAAACATLRG